jgi:DNA repair exonuclease SbcCD nuclease subunit
MKKLTIFTDPHLGTSRAAHTTRSSAAALQQELYNQAMHIVETAEHPIMCVGDLFDKAFNPERVLLQGFNVASRCWMTLAGNHDMTNRVGTVTSLDALAEMGVPVCRAPDLTNPYFEARDSIYMVPHHASQAVFIDACFNAAAHAANEREGKASFLFLHCNYDFSLAVDDNTLNLPADIAERLLNAFDFIFIGHEHNRSRHQDGRVVALGNTHPTSFHDISDKYTYTLDLETAVLEEHICWSADRSYCEIELGSDLTAINFDCLQFIDVVGVDKPASAVEVNQFIQEVWKASHYQPVGEEGWYTGLLAVRNKVILKDALLGLDSEVAEVQVMDLKTKIQKELHGSELLGLFNQLVTEVTA